MSYLQHQIAQLIQCSKAQEGQEPYYEVLEYIQTTGVEYFDTELVASDLATNDYYNVKGIFKGVSTNSASQIMFGISASAGGWCGIPASKNYYGFGTSNLSTVAYNTESFFDISITNISTSTTTKRWSASGTVDGNTISTRAGGGDYAQGNYTLTIGGGRQQDDSTLISFGCAMQIKACHIAKNTTETKDYLPVLDSQLRPCLYDRVSKTFLYAKKIADGTDATSTLTYQRWNKFDVDYIESSGTQYINTGFKFTNTSAFELVCAKTGAFNDSSVFCGARNGTDTTTNARVLDYSYSAPSTLRGEFILLQRGGYDVQNNVLYIPYDTDFHTYYESPTRMSIDDTDRPTVPELVSPDLDFYLFWQNVGNATAPNKSSIKVKSLKLWDNGIPARYLKPTVWHNGNTTAVACLYDEVYNKMYTNAGTGSLKAYIEPNKELFTQAGALENKVLDADGVINDLDDFAVSDKIPVNPSSTVKLISGSYFASATSTGGSNWRFSVYNSSNQQITQYVLRTNLNSTVPAEQTETLANNASYMRVSYRYTKPSGAPAGAILNTSTLSIKDTTTYEVGSNCFVSPATASQQVTNNYFNSGMYGNENWNVKLIAFTSTNVAGQLFGNFINSTATNNLTINSGTATGTGAISRFDGQVMTQDKIINMGANSKSLLQINKIGAWQDSTQIVAWNNPNSFTTSGTCYIGGTNGSATVRPNGCCYLLIEENQTPIAEYIPVKNATVTSEYGLYDRVSGTLNTGVGTITFNALS